MILRNREAEAREARRIHLQGELLHFANTESRRRQGQPVTDPLFCLLYTSPSPRDKRQSRMPSSA